MAERIVVVDDDAMSLRLAMRVLDRAGMESLGFSSGPEALELLLAHDIALAFLDVLMKGKIQTMLRRSRGKDVSAACGQLRLHMEKV